MSQSAPVRFVNEAAGHSEDKTIIVLGVGRGGTSAMAGFVRELGVEMPRAHPLKHEWSPISTRGDQIDHDATRHTIAALNRLHPIWGWKSPRDVFLLDQCLSYVRNPQVVVVFRNILDICESSARHEDLQIEVGFPEAAAAYSRIAEFVAYSSIPMALISYERLLAEGSTIAPVLSEWLGLGASTQRLEAACAFVGKPGLYRPVKGANHNGKFNKQEIKRDQARAQLSIYGSRARFLANAVSHYSEDIEKASRLAQGLRRLVVETIQQDFSPDLEFLEGAIADQIPYLSLEQIAKVLGLTSLPPCMAKLRSKNQEVATQKALDLQIRSARMASFAYHDLRARYFELIRRRIEIQQDLDSLNDKLEFLRAIKAMPRRESPPDDVTVVGPQRPAKKLLLAHLSGEPISGEQVIDQVGKDPDIRGEHEDRRRNSEVGSENTSNRQARS